MEAPLALAFTAGLVAIVNPCGFALLPAYLSFFMGMDDRRETPPVAIAKGLVVGGVVSSGFLAVFGLTGVLVTVGLRPVITFVPWAALIVGAAVAVLGVAMLAGWQPLVGLPKLEAGGGSRRYRSVFVFGVGYAVASLSCTLPIFLAVVAGSLVQTSIVGAWPRSSPTAPGCRSCCSASAWRSPSAADRSWHASEERAGTWDGHPA